MTTGSKARGRGATESVASAWLALAVALLVAGCGSLSAPAQFPPTGTNAIAPVVAPAASLFSLQDVRLLSSPFLQARGVDQSYLLRLNPDRLLYFMRQVSGLPPKAAGGYGGWDSGGSGMVGHYLSACAMMAAATGDATVLARVNYVVSEMAACQQARGNGSIVSSGGDATWFSHLAAGQLDPQGVTPWYITHKNLAGLRDAWVHCGNTQARDTLVHMADWVIAVTSLLTDQQWQDMLAGEHGGPHEILADVYAFTGDPKHLAIARKFRHNVVFDPLLAGNGSALDYLHANTQIPKFTAYDRIYDYSGEPAWHTAATNFWQAVVADRTWANGGNSQWERFFPTNQFTNEVHAGCGPETCNTYNLLKLTRQLFTHNPQAALMDYYERALYNHILSSQDPTTGGKVYYTSMRPYHYRVYSSDYDSFWCCVGTGMENHGRYGEMIYAQATNALYVNLFIPSRLTWAQKGLTLEQTTAFPQENKTTLALNLQQPQAFTLNIRCPAWAGAGELQIRINDELQAVGATPGAYAALTRTWNSGDVVEVTLPMRIRIELLPQTTNYAAIFYGPILLAGALGTEGLGSRDFFSPLGAMDQLARKLLSEDKAPMLVGSLAQIAAQVTLVTNQPLTFQTRQLAHPCDVTLVPFYELHRQRYAVYWRVTDPDTWVALHKRVGGEDRYTSADQLATTDHVIVGDSASEAAHNLASSQSRTGSGILPYNWWRDATGWFSYQVRVLPASSMKLRCIYWGTDGGRTFDVLVDGQKIASQTLNGARPGDFLPALYSIPATLTAGKTNVTVRFAAQAGSLAGGLFDLCMLSPVTNDIPGRVEAENYTGSLDTTTGNSGGAYRNEDVDIRTCYDQGNNFLVGWTAAGEWLAYDLDALVATNYTVTARVCAPAAGSSFRVELDGRLIATPVTIPAMGAWDTWTNVAVNLGFLSAGPHRFRFLENSSGFDVNYFDFEVGTAPALAAAGTSFNLSWPVDTAFTTVYSATNLGPSASWQREGRATNLDGAQWSFPVPAPSSKGKQFYRLGIW